MDNPDANIRIKYKRNSFAGPVHEEEIATTYDILLELGVRIDEAYFAHITQHNGGVPRTPYFPAGKSHPASQVERFLNFADSYRPEGARYRNFNVNVVSHWIKDRVPKHIVPIATIPHGGFLCLFHTPDTLPTVVMWNDEAATEEYALVAPTFAAFTQMLTDNP